MGKKRIIKKGGDTPGTGKTAPSSRAPKRKVSLGRLYVDSTYNNTKMILADRSGNCLAWSSSGSLGFKGAKKGTPFASAKVGEVLADKAIAIGVKEVDVVIKGVGAGREAGVRSFSSRGIDIVAITDQTPVPHNGPKAPKPRRV